VNVEEVSRLVEERLELRVNRDFQGADCIRDELDRLGVVVSDRTMSWHIKDNERPACCYVRTHSDTSDVDLATVEELLRQRAKCREQRDWQGADALRDELRDAHRVSVSDRELEWFVVDNKDPRIYRRSPDCKFPIDESHVEALLLKRAELRAARDFKGADEIRDQLKALSVVADDRRLQWFVNLRKTPRGRRGADANFGPLGHDYSQADDDEGSLDEDAIRTVNQLLALRLSAKLERRFDEADEVFNQLAELGVSVHDGFKRWRSDGKDFGSEVYTRIGPLHPDEEEVLRLIEERGLARKAREYETADKLADHLYREHQVRCDDREKIWYVEQRKLLVYERVGPAGSEEQDEKVAALLLTRTEAKVRRDFETADRLQEELFHEHGVVLDNRALTWKYRKAPETI